MFALATIGFVSTSCTGEGGSSNDSPITPGNGNGTNVKYVHKVILEDITSVGCIACPYAAQAIAEVKALSIGSRVIPVGAHIDYGMSDPMKISYSVALRDHFVSNYGLDGYPFVLINRDAKWAGNMLNNKAQVANALSNSSPIGIKISSNLTNTGGTVTASFKFSQGYENLNYSIYILENEIVSPQKRPNYPNNIDQNYSHLDVLRATASSNITGSSIGSVTPGQEVVKSNQQVSFSLFNNDLSKVEVVVFVTGADGKVLNAQIAHANETKDYQVVQ